MADEQIERLYIDIEVKNTGLNTLKTANENLQQLVNNINSKGIDVSITKNTLNTITYLSNLARQLGNIQRILSRPLVLNVQKIESAKVKGADRKLKSGNALTTTFDSSGREIGQITKTTGKSGFSITSQTNAFGQELKRVEEYIDSTGSVFKDVFKNTVDLENGITKNTYAVEKNGEEWLKTKTVTKQTTDGLLKTTTSYDKLGKQISEVTRLTDKFGNVTTKTSGELKSSRGSVTSFGNGIVSSAAKLTILGYGFSQISSIFSSFIQKSNSYIENLNLFQVTFGNMADEAQRFAETYSEALGLDVSQTLRDMAVFNQIVTGFGVSREEGYQMSKLLTQLSYDLSSFMNIDFEDAVLKFQSGIAGELEPLRRVGYALDEATLQQVAYNAGITESIRTMTQAEKAYIRLLAMYEQSENVMGDLAGTIDSPANALRILQQQFTQLQRSIGNAIVPIVTKLIPIIQGATKALTEFFNMIAIKLGYEVEGTRENAYADYMDNITTSAQEAENAINGTLLSFDKFSVLGGQDKTDENFTLPIPDYDALATLADSITDTSESFSKTYELLSNILMNEDHTDLAPALVAIGQLINAIWEGLSNLWNTLIVPIVLPSLTAAIKILGDILSILADILNVFDGLDVIVTALIMLALISTATKKIKSLFTDVIGIFSGLKNVIAKLSIAVVYEFGLMSTAAKILSISFSAIGIAAGVAFGYWLSTLDSSTRRTVGILTTLIAVLTAAAVAWAAYHTSMTLGVAAPLILTAVAFGAAGLYGIISSYTEGFATGGFTPKTSGSLFMAGENGKPELMGDIGGKNAVANVNSIEESMERASYRGMIMAISQSNANNSQQSNQDIVLQIDGKELARANVKNTANALSRNYKVELNPR